MIDRRRFPRIFFGWWTVLASSFLFHWGHGYYTSGFSALFKPIASELGFSRAATSVAAGIGRFEGGFEAPLTGWLTDRFGPKVIILVGTFLIGLGLILMNFIGSLWAFYLVWGGILGSGVNVALSTPMDKAVANWFVKKRGLAMGVKGTIVGLSFVTMVPLISWLASTQSWRIACVIGGVVMLVVGVPLVWFFVKQHRPEYYGLLPDGATVREESAPTSQMIDRGVKYATEVQEVEFTLRQAMRTRAFWLLLVANTGTGMIWPTFMMHIIPLLTDIGISPMRAAGMVAMAGAISLPARFFGGFLADRVKKRYLRFQIGGAHALQVAAIIPLLLNQTIATVYVFLFLWWFAQGTTVAAMPALRARYFGRKSFGSIQGISAMIMAPFGIIAPVYTGWIYDTTGSYIPAFTVFTPLVVFSAVVMFLALPPKPPAHIGDIHEIL